MRQILDDCIMERMQGDIRTYWITIRQLIGRITKSTHRLTSTVSLKSLHRLQANMEVSMMLLHMVPKVPSYLYNKPAIASPVCRMRGIGADVLNAGTLADRETYEK